MRTVFVHLRNATQEQVEAFLERTYTRQHGPPWIGECDCDACLYINIYHDLRSEAEPEELASLHKELGGEPTVSVSADVSGRHRGDEQVRDFVSKLLSEFDGLAQDEYTEGFWTLDEIRSEHKKPGLWGSKKDGHTFSD
jgi:hypothetical protein